MKPKNERDFLDRCQSLVILGGTFDPIHIGHIAIAKAVSQQLKPQRILFLPCGKPAHKLDRHITDQTHRYNMTVLATCEEPTFDISRLELERPGTSYTIDTLRDIKAICPKGAEISFVIGADAASEMILWKSIDEVLSICQFIVIPRPGCDDAKAQIDFMTKTYGGRFVWLDMPMINISSTDIRERFAMGRTVEGLVPKHVESYVRLHNIYQTGPANFENALQKLRIQLSPKRFAHTIGVVDVAEKLAAYYNQDIQKARWAALLHDCTKEYSADKKRALCKIWGVQLDEIFEANIDITHSLLSAESARRDFYINDPEILQAIRYHTTGHKHMAMLDKIIMLADYIEPNRENWGPIDEMRRLQFININQALILGTKYTIKEEEEAKNPIHTWSYDALRELKKEEKNER